MSSFLHSHSPVRFAGALISAMLLSGLSACASKEQTDADKLKRIIASEMKDPDSVKFRNLRMGSIGNSTLCGEINAKNSFGAFSGFEKFSLNGPGAVFMESRLRSNVEAYGNIPNTSFDKALANFEGEWRECQSNGKAVR